MFANGQVAMILVATGTDGLDGIGLKAGVDYDTFILPPSTKKWAMSLSVNRSHLFGKNAPTQKLL